MKQRFIRTEQLLGKDVMKKLSQAKVAIFGLGAVGSYALEALARSGVGAFVLVDFDKVKYSNFNRQLLALESTVGESKVELAVKRVRQINPSCKVEPHLVFADQKNLPFLLESSPDVVIDAIDSMTPKAQVIAYCAEHHIPIISSMGAGLRLDPFSIRVGDIRQARNCMLAVRLLKQLKKKHAFDKELRCVYSIEKPHRSHVALESEEEEYQRGRLRMSVGTISYMTGMFGLMIAYEAIRLLLEEGKK